MRLKVAALALPRAFGLRPSRGSDVSKSRGAEAVRGAEASMADEAATDTGGAVSGAMWVSTAMRAWGSAGGSMAPYPVGWRGEVTLGSGGELLLYLLLLLLLAR